MSEKELLRFNSTKDGQNITLIFTMLIYYELFADIIPGYGIDYGAPFCLC